MNLFFNLIKNDFCYELKMSSLSLSSVFGIISMICYAVLYFPQIYAIIKLNTSQGISVLTVNIWCIADCFNLIAVLILQLETSLVYIGWYHMIMSCILLIIVMIYMDFKQISSYEIERNSQIVIMNNFKNFVMMYVSIMVIVFVLVMTTLTQVKSDNLSSLTLIGEILAWISIAMYFFARLPQVYKNYVKKTTYGLSINMFVISILANTFYLLTILTVSLEQAYILKNLPWIVFAVSTSLIDFVILFQCNYYS